MPNQSLVRGQIAELVHIAPIKQGYVPGRTVRYADRLRTTLEAFNRRDAQGFPSVIRLFRGIHTSKWALLDGDTRLLVSVVFDGTLHAYLRGLARDIPGMLHMIWSNCEGWQDPTDDAQRLIDFIERHEARASFFYAQHPQLTVPDVEQLLELRDASREDVPDLEAALYERNRPLSNEQRLKRLLAHYGSEAEIEASKQAFVGLFNMLYTKEEVDRAVRETYGAPVPQPAPQRPDSERDRQIQGDVLTEYRHAHCARMLFFHFADTQSARDWLYDLRPHIAYDGGVASDAYHLNVGFTHSGLQRLGIKAAVLSDFPAAFVEGMKARAAKLDESPAPEPCAGQDVHAVVFLHARVERDSDVYRALIEAGRAAQANADDTARAVAGDVGGREALLVGLLASHLDQTMEAMPKSLRASLEANRIGAQDLHRPLVPCSDDPASAYGVEYFGFRDGIGQPAPYEPVLRPDTPGLLANATFLVARKLEQNTAQFWESMAQHAPALGVTKRELAEQIVGRRMDGRRLDSRSAHYHPVHDRHAFDDKPDAKAPGCPFHSHVRRANPRVESSFTRNPTLVRRSLAYVDGRARGLVFLAYNADIETQFELIQRNWLHAGNQAGLAARDRDVMSGLPAPKDDPYADRGPARFYAELPDQHGNPSPHARELSFAKTFVTLEWGLYLYIPARAALEKL